MAKGFRPVDRDQEFLLPPNMIDWLPAEHVVWFLIDVVAELDLDAFYQRAALRRDGLPPRSAAGRAAYDPAMLLTLLIYGYACGERSSRQLERLCHTDVAFRVICAEDIPDHTVLARFRQTHQDAFAGVFTQVLRLCRAAGLVKLCTVAIDGTKITANASKQATHRAQWFTDEAQRMDQQATEQATEQATGPATDEAADRAAEQAADRAADEAAEQADRAVVAQILADAAVIDEREDAQYGPDRGDELPPSWHGRQGRRERLRAAQAAIVAAEAAREAAAQAAEQEAAAARAQRAEQALVAATEALAVKIAAREAARAAWEQAWEHAVAHPGTPVPTGAAPVSVDDSAQIRRARERVAAARARAADPEAAPRRGRRPNPDPAPTPPPRANLTDPDSVLMPTKDGWIQGYNDQFAVSADQIIVALEVTTSTSDIDSYHRMVAATETAAALLDARTELGTLLFDAGYASDATLTAHGPDRLIALGKSHSLQAAARDNPASGPPPPAMSARQAMDHLLRTPQGANLYKRRGATVEPGIGNFKKILDRFSRRGLPAVTSETHLAAAVFNLLKIHRSATA